MILLLAGAGFAIGSQKHMLWLAVVLALLGAALAWLAWVMIRIAIFTIVGTILGVLVLGLTRSHLWLAGALAGAGLGFLSGLFLHKRARWRKKQAP
jgi:hypothetical protein